MFIQLLNIIAPILICACIGISWKKMGYEYPSDFIGRLVMNIGAPCLILKSLANTAVPLKDILDVVVVASIVLVVMFLVCLPILRAFKLNAKTYLPSLLFPNSGNMGLPLSLFAFGETGLTLAVGYFLMMMFGHLTLGILILEGTESGISHALKNLLKQPMLYAMVLGLMIYGYDLTLPLWISHSVNLLGGVTIPLMLITLGVSLTSLKVEFWQRALFLSFLRVGLSLVLAFMICQMMGVSGITRDVILLQAAMPAAVFNYLFAVKYQQAPEEVAGLVVVSTVLAVTLLPLLLAQLIT